MLTKRIRQIHNGSRGTYGSPRVHAALLADGIRVGKKRVARLMKEAGLRGVSRRKTPTTTRREPVACPAPDLVDRDFSAEKPDELWVADITYVPTWAGFLYLAVVLDAFSRRIAQKFLRRLGNGGASTHRARPLGPGHGGPAAPTRGDHSPLRSRLSVHGDRLRSALQSRWRAPLDGFGRRLLGQRHCEPSKVRLGCCSLYRATY